MTEDEAKTKWCPQTLGRTPPNPEACGGSACMAWRWSGEADPGAGFVKVKNKNGSVTVVSEAFAKSQGYLAEPTVSEGFCGLARSPAHD